MVERGERVAYLPGVVGERALLARLLAGEDRAYRECYDLFAPDLMRFLVRVVRNQAQAEEILQETFLAAFRGLGGYRAEVRLSTWLTSIAFKKALNELRGESRRSKNLPPPPSASHSPEPWLAERDLTRKVLAILQEMDAPKRLALLLQAEGHSVAEIAVIFEEPRGTILSRLSRARAELAERVAAAGLAERIDGVVRVEDA